MKREISRQLWVYFPQTNFLISCIPPEEVIQKFNALFILETTEHSSPPTAATTAIPSDLICISTYDAILIVANINKLITDIQNSQKGIEQSFNPMFDVVNVDGCFQLKLSEIYTSLFGSAVQEFLNNNVIGEINSLLKPTNEQADKCPNESDAKMVGYSIDWWL